MAMGGAVGLRAAPAPPPAPPPPPPFKLPAGATELEGRIMTGSVTVLPGHAKKVTCLAWAPDGAYLASGSGDTTVQLWKCGAAAVPSVRSRGCLL